MTKAKFVESLADTLNQTKSESERVLEAVVDVLKQALQRGEKIDLHGLGVFKVRQTKPRQHLFFHCHRQRCLLAAHVHQALRHNKATDDQPQEGPGYAARDRQTSTL